MYPGVRVKVWLHLIGILPSAVLLWLLKVILVTNPLELELIVNSPLRLARTYVVWRGSNLERQVAGGMLWTTPWITNVARVAISSGTKRRLTEMVASSNIGYPLLLENGTSTCLGGQIGTLTDRPTAEEKEKEETDLPVITIIPLETTLSETHPGITRSEIILCENTLVITPPASTHVIICRVTPHATRGTTHVILEKRGIDDIWKLFTIGMVGAVLITPLLHPST